MEIASSLTLMAAAALNAKLERMKMNIKKDEMMRKKKIMKVKRRLPKGVCNVRANLTMTAATMPPTPDESSNISSSSSTSSEQQPPLLRSIDIESKTYCRLNKFGQRVPLTPPYSDSLDFPLELEEADESNKYGDETKGTNENLIVDVNATDPSVDEQDDSMSDDSANDDVNNNLMRKRTEEVNYTDVSLSSLDDDESDWWSDNDDEKQRSILSK